MVADREVELGDRSDGAKLDGVVLTAVGGDGLPEVRKLEQLGVTFGFARGQLGLLGRQGVAKGARLGFRGGGVLAALLRVTDRLRRAGALGTRLLDRGAKLAAAGVDREKGVEPLGDAAAGEGRPNRVGVRAYQPQVEQGISALGGRGRGLGQRRDDTVAVVAEDERPAKSGDLEHAAKVPLRANHSQRAIGGSGPVEKAHERPEPGRVEQRHVREVDDDLGGCGVELVGLLAERPHRVDVELALQGKDRLVAGSVGGYGKTHGPMLSHAPRRHAGLPYAASRNGS
jgi:hypothetical protein